MIGKALSHFLILAKIGEGGMGVVYKAQDQKLHRLVALKVLSPELVGDQAHRLRFLRGAQAAAAVNHPNIATIHEVDEADGSIFIAMEYLEGGTLGSRLGGHPLPVGDALRIAVGIANGLAQAHRSRVLHRDLKPENVILGPEGDPKILDFGIAKLLDAPAGADDLSPDHRDTTPGDVTREGVLLGTVSYMSPEQARGRPADHRSDLFSFGAVLYEMVTGKAPFLGRTATDTLAAIVRDEAVPASRMNPEVPAELDRVVQRCLQKDPDDRYQDARELVADLVGVRPASFRRAPAWTARALRPRTVVAVGIVAVALLATFALWRSGRRPESPTAGAGGGAIQAVAVLPLQNLSRDPDQDFFTDGMTDALITELARIGAVRVISRTSVMQYKAVRKPLPEIARELKVDAVLEGSVQRSGNKVRITAQLIDAETDLHLWAADYERDLDEVLTLQSEVARAIAQEVRGTLASEEDARLGHPRPIDPEVYELYLKGRYAWNKRTEEGLKQGMEYFHRAIEKDPGCALAYAGLADAYFILGSWGFLDPAEAYPRAKAAARTALDLDETLAEAHASLGGVLMDHDLDWSGAEREYRRALKLNPSYATAHQWYAIQLAAFGRFAESIPEILRAHEIDPLSPIIGATVGRHYYLARRYDDAIAQIRRTLEMEPAFPAANYFLGLAYEAKGSYSEAIAALQTATSAGEGAVMLAALGHAYAASGDTGAAKGILRRLEGSSPGGPVSLADIALIYTALGERDQAFALLEQAFREQRSSLLFLKVDPRLDPLRSDPRLVDLMRRLGLPP